MRTIIEMYSGKGLYKYSVKSGMQYDMLRFFFDFILPRVGQSMNDIKYFTFLFDIRVHH